MTTTSEQTYVTYTVTHAAHMDDETRALFMEAVHAGLQRSARDRGLSIPDDPAAADIQRVTYDGPRIMDTEDGPVEVRISTYQAVAVGMPTLPADRVRAVEQEDGTWIADLPGDGVIVNVVHGLDTLDVHAHGLAGDGTPAALRHFLPIDRGEIEVIALPGAEHVLIERLPDDDTPEGA